MARDLIPPLSPAGRPAPDGAYLRGGGTPHLIELPPSRRARPRSRRRARRRRRRSSATASASCSARSAGVFVAAVLVPVVVVEHRHDAKGDGLIRTGRPGSPPTPASRAARPDRREGRRRVPASRRRAARARDRRATGHHRRAAPGLGEISVLDDAGVLYRLDGLGPNGSILGGQPSRTRLKFVQREALELALYTFRYLPDVKQVVTLLPARRRHRGDQGRGRRQSATMVAQDAAPRRNRRRRGGRRRRAGGRRAAGKAATTTTPDPIRTAVFYRPGDLHAAAADAARRDARRPPPDAGGRSSAGRRTIVDVADDARTCSSGRCRSRHGRAPLVLDPLQPLPGSVFELRAPARDLEHPRVGVLAVRARAGRRARIRQVSAAPGAALRGVRAAYRRRWVSFARSS